MRRDLLNHKVRWEASFVHALASMHIKISYSGLLGKSPNSNVLTIMSPLVVLTLLR